VSTTSQRFRHQLSVSIEHDTGRNCIVGSRTMMLYDTSTSNDFHMGLP
jgi:hypothetical protein